MVDAFFFFGSGSLGHAMCRFMGMMKEMRLGRVVVVSFLWLSNILSGVDILMVSVIVWHVS